MTDQTWTEWLSPDEFNSTYPLSSGIPLNLLDFIPGNHATIDEAWDAQPSLEVMYVFLDDAQLKMFAESEHSYLITTVKHHTFKDLNPNEQNLSLQLHEPIKELVWMAQRSDVSKRNDWFNFTNYQNKDETETEHLNSYVNTKPSPVEPLTVTQNTGATTNFPTPATYNCVVGTNNTYGGVGTGMTFDISLDATTLTSVTLTDRGTNYLAGETITITQDDLRNITSTPSLTITSSIVLTVPNFTDTDIENFYTANDDKYKKTIVKKSQILLNNQPRTQEKEAHYYNKLQPFWYYKASIPDGINVFSFSLYPKEHQPSGSCNMAQINKVDLRVDIVEPEDPDVKYNMSVYSIGYNILRIQNGIGGLAFSS